MNYPPIPQMETSRLILRKFRMSDLENHHLYITSDPEVAKNMLWQANPEISHAEQVLQRILSRYGTQDGYRWAIARKADDACIGTISLLRLDSEASTCSFAYMLGKPFWNRGYMTEVLQAVFDFCFSEMGIAAISADHFSDNPASGAVMRKAGMRRVALLPKQYEKDGIWHDSVLYTITREDWNALRSS